VRPEDQINIVLDFRSGSEGMRVVEEVGFSIGISVKSLIVKGTSYFSMRWVEST
jgi:hypothetical protein